MLLHYVADENARHGLKELAIRYTKYGDYEKPMYDWIDQYKKANGLRKADFSWDMIPFDVMYTYAACDAIVTFLLFERFVKVLLNPKLAAVYNDILIPGCRFLTDIQDNGVPFNPERLEHAQVLMQQDIDNAVAEMYKNPKIAEFEKIQGKQFNPKWFVSLCVGRHCILIGAARCWSLQFETFAPFSNSVGFCNILPPNYCLSNAARHVATFHYYARLGSNHVDILPCSQCLAYTLLSKYLLPSSSCSP